MTTLNLAEGITEFQWKGSTAARLSPDRYSRNNPRDKHLFMLLDSFNVDSLLWWSRTEEKNEYWRPMNNISKSYREKRGCPVPSHVTGPYSQEDPELEYEIEAASNSEEDFQAIVLRRLEKYYDFSGFVVPTTSESEWE